jgi:glycosyltransferase involved in cell wall biosynthesis
MRERGISAAAFHRIDLLRNYCQAAGHTADWRWQYEFSGAGNVAWFADKRKLKAWIDSCDAVYTGSTDPAAHAAAASKGKKIIYDCHTPAIGENLMLFKSQKNLRNFVLYLRTILHETIAARRSRVITTVSDSAVQYFHTRFKRDLNDLFLVRNPVDLEAFKLLPMPQTERASFAYVGGMDRWQGIPDLIEAYASGDRSYDLTIVGFDDENEPLRQKAESVGIRAFRRMPRQQALKVFENAHFGVTATPKICAVHMPGAFPTKWAEYLALGRAVAVTRAYDCAKLTEDLRCGVVMEPGAAGICAGLKTASGIRLGERDAMAQRGRCWVTEHCSLERAGVQFLAAADRAAGT